MPPARSLALITGASGGIGADLARVFARHGHDLALTARSGDKLDALADEIAAMGRPRPLTVALDLAAPGACRALTEHLSAAGAQVRILVNNAGFGLAGQALDLDRAEQLGMIDLNIRALVELTLLLAPQLERGGCILNVASVAAYLPGPGLAVYFASKAFVLSFSEALRQELAPRAISVTALCPGATATGFQARAGFRPDMRVANVAAMPSMAVAEQGFAGLMAGRRVVVPGWINKLFVQAAALAPRSWLLPLIARAQMRRTQAP